MSQPKSVENRNFLDIGNRIREIRERYRLTQDAFSAKFGMQKGTLLRYEKGYNPPASEFLFQMIEDYPAINGDWLLTGRGEMMRAEVSDPVPVAGSEAHAQRIEFLLDELRQAKSAQPLSLEEQTLLGLWRRLPADSKLRMLNMAGDTANSRSDDPQGVPESTSERPASAGKRE